MELIELNYKLPQKISTGLNPQFYKPVYNKTFASNQPMLGPTGLVYYMKYRYGETQK